jgi:hypothetical protein
MRSRNSGKDCLSASFWGQISVSSYADCAGWLRKTDGFVTAKRKKEPTERLCEFGDVKIPILEIPVDHAPALIIGRRSGRAILEHLDAIRSFMARQEITRHAVEQMCERGINEEY